MQCKMQSEQVMNWLSVSLRACHSVSSTWTEPMASGHFQFNSNIFCSLILSCLPYFLHFRKMNIWSLTKWIDCTYQSTVQTINWCVLLFYGYLTIISDTLLSSPWHLHHVKPWKCIKYRKPKSVRIRYAFADELSTFIKLWRQTSNFMQRITHQYISISLMLHSLGAINSKTFAGIDNIKWSGDIQFSGFFLFSFIFIFVISLEFTIYVYILYINAIHAGFVTISFTIFNAMKWTSKINW